MQTTTIKRRLIENPVLLDAEARRTVTTYECGGPIICPTCGVSIDSFDRGCGFPHKR